MSTGSPDRRFPDTVLHVVDGLGLSGKTRNLVSLATQVDRRRFAPVVCTLGSESSPLREHLEAAGVPVYTLGCGDGLQFGAAVRLARLARAVKADIIHCYNPRPMLRSADYRRNGRASSAIPRPAAS